MYVKGFKMLALFITLPALMLAWGLYDLLDDDENGLPIGVGESVTGGSESFDLDGRAGFLFGASTGRTGAGGGSAALGRGAGLVPFPSVQRADLKGLQITT